MIRRILVAYDGSEQAGKAFRVALEIAEKFGAEVIVLSVATLPEPPEAVETEAVIENAREHYTGAFAALRAGVSSSPSMSIRHEIRIGHAAEQILHMASEENVDMIVMGHTGKSMIRRWLLGSVSKRVISYALCTVSIVR